MTNKDFADTCDTLEAFFAQDGIATVGNYHLRREYKTLKYELRISYDAVADKLLIEQCTLGHQPRSQRQTFFMMLHPASATTDHMLVAIMVSAGIITSESLVAVYKQTVKQVQHKNKEVAA